MYSLEWNRGLENYICQETKLEPLPRELFRVQQFVANLSKLEVHGGVYFYQ